MMIRTKLADQPEQFQDGEAWHAGRRVEIEIGKFTYDVSRTWYLPDGKQGGTVTFDAVLFQLDCDAGLVFVDPSILRPYQRPERKEND